MTELLSAVVLAATIAWAVSRIVAEMSAGRREQSRGRTAQLLSLFAPALGAAQTDPRSVLVWQPLARTARQLFPEEFAALDRAAGFTFPMSRDTILAAHARWTADWLAWERAHDFESKLKAAALEEELARSGSSLARARLDAAEREKLERYQQRYEEYVRIAKAIQALAE